MISGSCLCGKVAWLTEGALSDMTHCHCSMCRKIHGTAFATYVRAPRGDLRFVSGIDTITMYASSPGFVRPFCSECGSVVPDPEGEGAKSMPAACLNEDPVIRPSAHIFAPSKASWYQINDDLPQFDAYADPEEGPIIDRPAPSQSKDGILHGSCLCGDVAYEVRTAIKAVHNCHCSRCQKARAAAHATNGFTVMDGVKFLRGEERLKTYKLPAAQFFTQVFCTRCGSAMPRKDPVRGIAIIPFGSLDTDPGRGAEDHIFTGSKASWYEIHDDLPQFEETPG